MRLRGFSTWSPLRFSSVSASFPFCGFVSDLIYFEQSKHTLELSQHKVIYFGVTADERESSQEKLEIEVVALIFHVAQRVHLTLESSEKYEFEKKGEQWEVENCKHKQTTEWIKESLKVFTWIVLL